MHSCGRIRAVVVVVVAGVGVRLAVWAAEEAPRALSHESILKFQTLGKKMQKGLS